jgi:hypothetical protein
MIAQRFASAVRFFLDHANYGSDRRIFIAWAYAKAEERARAEGLTVTWEDDDPPWDGECEAPAILAVATVFHPDMPRPEDGGRFPFVDSAKPRDGWTQSTRPGTLRRSSVLASLGGIGLDSWRDPYVRVVEAELLSEALEELDAERDHTATIEAEELSARATYAGVSS